jgi:hypothetical protein
MLKDIIFGCLTLFGLIICVLNILSASNANPPDKPLMFASMIVLILYGICWLT